MDRVFQFALSPARHKCLLVPLEPLTLSHVFSLERHIPGFLERGIITAQELATAVLICCQPPGECERTHKSFWHPILVRWWAFRCRNLDMLDQEKLFAAYIKDGFTSARMSVDLNSAGKEFYSPWPFRLLAMATSVLGLSVKEATEMPLAMLNALWASKGDAEDSVKFWTKDHEDFWEAAHAADMAAQRN